MTVHVTAPSDRDSVAFVPEDPPYPGQGESVTVQVDVQARLQQAREPLVLVDE